MSESATFTPDGAIAPIDNVVSRVTGGRPSEIDGTLRSTIPDADFYFLNPTGLLFGPNGRLDMRGSFHASTGDRLEFDDGSVLEVVDLAPLLTVASPVDFGFLSSNDSSITVKAFLISAQPIAFTGNSILVEGSVSSRSSIVEQGGEIVLEASDSVVIGGRSGRVDVSSLGEGAAGRIAIQAQDVTIAGDVLASAYTGPGNAGTITIDADRIDIHDRLGGAFVLADASGGGRAGVVSLSARESVKLSGTRAVVGARGAGDSSGGTVMISADVIEIREGFVETPAWGEGDAGSVTLTGREIKLLDGSLVLSAAWGRGAPGAVTVTASESLLLEGDREDPNYPGVGSIRPSVISLVEPGTVGDGGVATIRASEITLKDRGGIFVDGAGGVGKAGQIRIEADRVLVTSGGSISANAFGGDAGEIRITTDYLGVTGGGWIAASAFGAGGSIIVDAQEVVVSNKDGGPFNPDPTLGTAGKSPN